MPETGYVQVETQEAPEPVVAPPPLVTPRRRGSHLGLHDLPDGDVRSIALTVAMQNRLPDGSARFTWDAPGDVDDGRALVRATLAELLWRRWRCVAGSTGAVVEAAMEHLCGPLAVEDVARRAILAAWEAGWRPGSDPHG